MIDAGLKHEIWVPEMRPEVVRTLAERIRPIMRFIRTGNGVLIPSATGDKYFIRPHDLFRVDFTWRPTPTEKAKRIEPHVEIKTFHVADRSGLFKPSVAEVLVQIPTKYVDTVVAFEMVGRSKESAWVESRALAAGYHAATTRLFVHS